MRPLLLVLAVLAGCQCQRPTLVSSDGELRAGAVRIDFGNAWLESTVRKGVALSNSGRAR